MTDAKQRGIISQRFAEYPGGSKEPYWVYRYCSEPPPDAFSTLGYALAAHLNGEVTPLADGEEAANLQAAISGSLSEIGSTIERTQTINLLRESMFRTCERYMNGAITQREFTIQTARDQRAMVSILAIEQLTGVTRGNPVILVANGKATNTAATPEMIEQYFKSSDDLKKATAAHRAAELALKSAQSKEVCTTAPNPAENAGGGSTPASSEGTSGEGDTSGDTSTASTSDSAEAATEDTPAPECIEAAKLEELKQAEKSSAEDLRNAASTHANLEAVIRARNLSTTSDGEAIQASNRAQSSQDIQQVVMAIRDIVNATFDDSSELIFTCTSMLSNDQINQNDPLHKSCVKLIDSLTNKAFGSQTTTYSRSDCSQKIVEFWKPSGTLDEQNEQAIKDWMGANGMHSQPITMLIYGADQQLQCKAAGDLTN